MMKKEEYMCKEEEGLKMVTDKAGKNLKKELEELNRIMESMDGLKEGQYFNLTIMSSYMVKALQKIRDILTLLAEDE